MRNYSIKDLENLSGIKAHTLRIWEQRYNLLHPERTDSNIRKYSDHELRHIMNVSLLNKNGYKISAIAEMNHTQIEEQVLKISSSEFSFDTQINTLISSMTDFDEEKFEKIFSTNILQNGFEKTILNIIFPFLKRIGVMWQIGNITPSQEHFISNLIRQKIIVAIDGQVYHSNSTSKTALLFLPESESHEISLLFLSYLLKARNHRVIYLGQSVPFNDLKSIITTSKPQFIFSIFTSAPKSIYINSYIENLVNISPNTKFIISGYQIAVEKIEIKKSSLFLFPDTNQIVDFIDKNMV